MSWFRNNSISFGSRHFSPGADGNLIRIIASTSCGVTRTTSSVPYADNAPTGTARPAPGDRRAACHVLGCSNVVFSKPADCEGLPFVSSTTVSTLRLVETRDHKAVESNGRGKIQVADFRGDFQTDLSIAQRNRRHLSFVQMELT